MLFAGSGALLPYQNSLFFLHVQRPPCAASMHPWCCLPSRQSRELSGLDPGTAASEHGTSKRGSAILSAKQTGLPIEISCFLSRTPSLFPYSPLSVLDAMCTYSKDTSNNKQYHSTGHSLLSPLIAARLAGAHDNFPFVRGWRRFLRTPPGTIQRRSNTRGDLSEKSVTARVNFAPEYCVAASPPLSCEGREANHRFQACPRLRLQELPGYRVCVTFKVMVSRCFKSCLRSPLLPQLVDVNIDFDHLPLSWTPIAAD